MKNDKAADILLIMSEVIITVLYISLIFNQNIWTDEAFTIQLVGNNNLTGIIKGTANDVHPPLYYLITKLFVTLFGSSFQIYKFVSIIPMALTMLLAVLMIRPWFGRKTAFLFVLFLNALPCVMEYGVQIRMYSWSIFFITFSALAVYGICIDGHLKYWIILSFSALCACYIHNFAMVSAAIIYILLGIVLLVRKNNFIKWILSGAAVGVCFVPWFFVLLGQTKSRVDNYWIEPVTASTVWGYFGDLFGSRLPYTEVMFAVFFLIVLIWIVTNKSSDRQCRFYVAALLLTPFLTALIGIIISICITPFFIARYLLPCMGLVALAFAICFGRVLDMSLSVLGMCAFLAAMIGSSYVTNYIDEYRSTHTDELLSYLKENMADDDIILYNYQLFGFIYECYFDADRLCFLDDMDFGSDYDTIWYFDSCTSPWLSDEVLEEYQLTKQYINTLGIEQNDFILYKISR